MLPFVRFLKLTPVERICALNRLLNHAKTQLLYKSSFAALGKGTTIFRPVLLSGTRFISIGDRVIVREGIRMEVIRAHSDRIPSLTIGNDTNIEQNVHIVCHNRITIGSNVSITGFCAIVDVTHPHRGLAPDSKIGAQIADDAATVEIGDGAFIGIGTVILPNVRIGRRAVIGANSVVTRSIPDGCVAAGVPARLINQQH